MKLNSTFVLHKTLGPMCWIPNLCMLSHAFWSWATTLSPYCFSRELNDVPYNVNVIDLHGCTAIRASDVIAGIFGHGFLIASDSLTRHP